MTATKRGKRKEIPPTNLPPQEFNLMSLEMDGITGYQQEQQVGYQQEQQDEFQAPNFEFIGGLEPAKKTLKKKAKTSSKRAEQNRIAQRNFREKQSQIVKEMKEKIESFDIEKQSLELVIDELKTEKENLIHLMDKLRSENMMLKDKVVSLESKTRNYQPSGEIRIHYHQHHSRVNNGHFVKGGFRMVMRPPLAQNRTQLPWTSHKNTFLDAPSPSINDSSSLMGAPSTGSGPLSARIVEDKTTSASASTSPHRQWADNNNYPGFPSWAPPTITAKLFTGAKPKGSKRNEIRNQPPNPPPFHLSFSYADTKHSHKVGGTVKTKANKEKMEIDNTQAPPNILPEIDFSSLFAVNQPSALIQAIPNISSIPLPGSLVADQSVFQPIFQMPFLPSTNAMVPLYHHMPFDTFGGHGFSQPFSTFNTSNSAWDQNALFSPEILPMVQTSNPDDPAVDNQPDRLLDVYLPLSR